MLVMVLLIVGILLIAMFIGTPVANALGIAAVVGILVFMEPAQLTRFTIVAYSQSTSMNQMVPPLFILMAEFLSRGGIASDIYNMLSRAMRGIKGGLALATTLACTIFAALCGSSPATAASIGRISIKQMVEKNYRPDFATGTVAAGGTLGIMIPPSLPFVMFGIITETSISKLLMAGLLPGIMLSALFCISIVIRCRLNPSLTVAAEEEYIAGAAVAKDEDGVSAGGLKLGASTAIPAGILILLVLGTLYTGVATPTEAAGFGAIGAFAIIVAIRRFTWDLFKDTLSSTVRTACMMILLIIMGLSLSYVVSYLGLAQELASFIIGTGMNRWVVFSMLVVLWLILGCLMDPGSMVVLTIPFIFPALTAMGFDPIWIGVISTLTVEIGMITPPVGLNLFILKSVSDIDIGVVMKGSLPYVIVMLAGLIILCVFPQIALVIPSHM
ncbi:MAG: TRAP transporter large permease [Clostridiales Family XIII bacterium]|jgi:C4-dicarboxylate transporter DctM subunit|nr:TRAP transporter large permease [Clostridiales Family XIII bacterium]